MKANVPGMKKHPTSEEMGCFLLLLAPSGDGPPKTLNIQGLLGAVLVDSLNGSQRKKESPHSDMEQRVDDDPKYVHEAGIQYSMQEAHEE